MADIPRGDTVLHGIGPRKPRRKASDAKRSDKARKLAARMPQKQALEFVPPPRPTRPAKKGTRKGKGE
jgi:hypothetical protein